MNRCCFDFKMQWNDLFTPHIATRKLLHVASIAGVNNLHNCKINCKALEHIILGMANNEWLQQRLWQRLWQSLCILSHKQQIEFQDTFVKNSAHCFYSIATFNLLKMLETIILLYSRKVWQGESLVNLANCS